MKKLLMGFLTLLIINSTGIAQDVQKTYTIYLIRHSEKVIDVNNLKDPPLTECGILRSESHVKYFASTEIDRIYSSDYVRTKETARPLAEARELEMEIYNANNLKEFAELLRERAQDAVVIGHSNTTPLLASHLTGQELYGIPDSDYSRIYQIVISKGSTIINTFHSTFECRVELKQ